MGFGTALGIGGAALSIFGSSKKAKAEKRAAEAEAARLRLNAEIAEEEAKAAERAQLEEQHIRKQHARKTISTARVKFAKSGFTQGKGSLMVLTQLAEDMARDIETVSLERTKQIKRIRDRARLGIIAAGDVEEAGKITSQTSLIQGFGSAALQIGSLLA
jgi:hypothetical protein